MASEVLTEEFEVLEAIYPTELTKLAAKEIRIDVEPEDINDGDPELKLTLDVTYPDAYPDVLPELSIDVIEGELDDDETSNLMKELQTVGEENLGMAMTFTLVSHLRELLSALIQTRAEQRKHAEMEKERLAIEAEEARTRGTPVTPESFAAWNAKFLKEVAVRRAREDEEKMRNLTAKEREEYKRLGSRLSGRQLFERNRDLDIADDSLLEEGTVAVDVSQFEREIVEDKEEEEGIQVTFSDSDSE